MTKYLGLEALSKLMVYFFLLFNPGFGLSQEQIELNFPSVNNEKILCLLDDSYTDWFNTNLDFSSTRRSNSFPIMEWPLEHKLYDEVFMMNYFDQSNPGRVDQVFRDYNCGSDLGYDGHSGTDITLFNFRLMDQGVVVKAAAAGKVVNVIYNEFDRHYAPPYSSNTPNLVRILHDDGSQSVYVHLRKNSVSPQIGEFVETGQFLGYVASSGSSPVPHLHIEFWEPGSISPSNATYRDPWEGNCNAKSTLWKNQEPYVPDNSLWIMDAGITTLDAVGGSLQNLSINPFKDRAFQPDVFGANETVMIAWVQLQAPVGDNYEVDMIHPNGSVFSSSGNVNITSYIRYWWHPYAWNISNASESDYGTWNMQVKVNGELVKEIPFEFGEKSYYKPRFYPLAGKSLRWNGNQIVDNFNLSVLSGESTFEIINQLPGISLLDQSVVISSAFNPTYRNTYFQVQATDDHGGQDTMWYHIVAPGQPVKSQTTSNSFFTGIENLTIYPNPVSDMLHLKFSIDRASPLNVRLVGITGQMIALATNALLYPGPNALEIPVESILPGTYILELFGDRMIHREKIILIDN